LTQSGLSKDHNFKNRISPALRLFKIFSAANWQHALGEVALIVVGILIALAANSWYEEKRLQQEEFVVLRQIHQSLAEDHQDLQVHEERLKRFAERAEVLYDALHSGNSWDNQFNELIGSLNAPSPLQFQTAPFEALRARGFDLVSDESLRVELIRLYDDLYAVAKRQVDADRDFVIGRVRPYLLEEFIRDPSHQWLAKDIETVKADGYLANLSKMRAYTLNEIAIPSVESAIDGNRRLSSAIGDIVGVSD
jgi:hypothetical protein